MMIEAPLGVILTFPPLPFADRGADIVIPGPCEFGWDDGVLIVIGPPDDQRGHRSRSVGRWKNAEIRVIAPQPVEP